MTTRIKGILIRAIINKLNDIIKEKNKRLCEENLHRKQTAIHGADMFFKLAYMSDNAITDIAKACGI